MLCCYFFSYSYGFSGSPRFFKWVLDSILFFIFSVTLGGQPFGFRRPLLCLKLAHYVCVYETLSQCIQIGRPTQLLRVYLKGLLARIFRLGDDLNMH